MNFDRRESAAGACFRLRRATRADAPALLRLIQALAEFEKLSPPDPASTVPPLKNSPTGFEARISIAKYCPRIRIPISAMKAAIFDAPQTMHVGDWSTPTVGPNEVLVAVKATGLCAGDIYIYQGKNPY